MSTNVPRTYDNPLYKNRFTSRHYFSFFQFFTWFYIFFRRLVLCKYLSQAISPKAEQIANYFLWLLALKVDIEIPIICMKRQYFKNIQERVLFINKTKLYNAPSDSDPKFWEYFRIFMASIVQNIQHNGHESCIYSLQLTLGWSHYIPP